MMWVACLIFFSFVVFLAVALWCCFLRPSSERPSVQLERKDINSSDEPFLNVTFLQKAQEPRLILQRGQHVTVQYKGFLLNGQEENVTSFDAGEITFPLGMQKVILGWDEGLIQNNVAVGDRIKLELSATPYGYGTKGAGNVIPPNADLSFDMDILSAKDAAAV